MAVKQAKRSKWLLIELPPIDMSGCHFDSFSPRWLDAFDDNAAMVSARGSDALVRQMVVSLM